MQSTTIVAFGGTATFGWTGVVTRWRTGRRVLSVCVGGGTPTEFIDVVDGWHTHRERLASSGEPPVIGTVFTPCLPRHVCAVETKLHATFHHAKTRPIHSAFSLQQQLLIIYSHALKTTTFG